MLAGAHAGPVPVGAQDQGRRALAGRLAPDQSGHRLAQGPQGLSWPAQKSNSDGETQRYGENRDGRTTALMGALCGRTYTCVYMCILNRIGYDSASPHRNPMYAATALSTPEDANSPARRTVSREDLLVAALKLIGPHRSLSTLSLREVAREAGIAPNSFYRQFRDMDELAVALIDAAGRSLRTIIGEARQRATSTATSVVRVSVRPSWNSCAPTTSCCTCCCVKARSAPDDFKHAVERELHYFEEELQHDLVRLAALDGAVLHAPSWWPRPSPGWCSRWVPPPWTCRRRRIRNWSNRSPR